MKYDFRENRRNSKMTTVTFRQMKITLNRIIKLKVVHFAIAVFLLYEGISVFSLSYPGWQSVYDADKSRVGHSKTPCKFPKLNINDSLMAPFFMTVSPLHCRQQPSVVCVSGDEARPCVPGQAATCNYRFINRKSDFKTSESEPMEVKSDSPVKLQSDFFHVDCVDPADGQSRSDLLAGVSFQADIWSRIGFDKLPKSASGVNFLMLGIDSLSHLTFLRKLPKTHKFLKEVLQAVTLDGYNIVGDGTPQALIPIFTGRTEKELPEVRRRKYFQSNYVNVYPFLWNNFSRAGYVTAYCEDAPSIGTFTYRLTGFDKQPTDHYLRTFYLEVDKIKHKHKPLCLGDTPRHKVLLDWILNYFNYYANQPKFLFAFNSELSHDDINLVELADDDLVAFLKSLKEKGHLDNTIVMMMSDHGHRFTKVRETPQGKYEERLPYFSIVVPKAFQEKYPKAWENIQVNAGRLTTPFDIHETIMSLLDLHGGGGDRTQRGISLFNEIPLLRSCEDAGIEPHWCTCLNWGRVAPDDPIVIKAANAFVSYLNTLTRKHRPLCRELNVEKIIWVEKYAPSASLMKFKESNDADGFQADFSSRMELSDVYYQLSVHTTPGGGHFEATAHYQLKKDNFVFNPEAISRINVYGNDGDCILNKDGSLQKYCYCSDAVPQ